MADDFDFGSDVEGDAFGQILDIDENGRDFSLPLYVEFCEQAQQQLLAMEEDLKLDKSKRDQRLAAFASAHRDQIDTFMNDHQTPDKAHEHLSTDEYRLFCLSNAGHFLKGSSSTLGLSKVQRGCTKIQHFGKHKDEDGNESDASDETLFSKLEKEVLSVTADFFRAKALLDRFFGVGGT